MAKDNTQKPGDNVANAAEPAPTAGPSAPEKQATKGSLATSQSPEDVVVVRTKREPLRWGLWFRITVIVLFGLLYVWDMFEAISNLFGKLGELARINEVRELNGFAPIDTPWAYLIANLLLPVVVFGLALLVARKRNVGILAMVLLAGLGVVAAISLSITAFVLQTT